MIEQLNKAKFLIEVFDYIRNDEWEYQGQLPCVIEFYNEACPPCSITRPIIEDLCRKYEGRVCFYLVDTSQETALTEELGVKNLPTVVLCPTDGKPVVFEGVGAKDKLRLAIERELLHSPSQTASNMG